jgi:hypothetical protein
VLVRVLGYFTCFASFYGLVTSLIAWKNVLPAIAGSIALVAFGIGVLRLRNTTVDSGRSPPDQSGGN